MIRRFFLAAVALTLGIFAIPKASAASFDLNIINCNCLPAGSTAGGSVLLTLVGTNEVDFVVSLTAPLNFHDTTFNAFAFSYSGAQSNITVTPADTTNFAASTTAGSGAMDGAGHSFTNFINYIGPSHTGNNTGITSLSFKVTEVAGGTALSLANFEILNGNSADFAAAVSNTGVSGCTGVVSGGNGTSASTAIASTGGASGACNGTTTVPEPTSVLLLGTGLLIAGKFLKMKLLV